MSSSTTLLFGTAIMAFLAVSPVRAFTLSFSNADFGTSPVFSNVTTFNFDLDVAGGLRSGLFADPTINEIEYNVRGTLNPGTPSGFSGFKFQLSHLVTGTAGDPDPIPILGSLFYDLNGSATNPGPGQTLRFEVASTANLNDGLQVDELEDLGGGVVLRFNGRETGEDGRPGRYHPAFLELRSDGTGIIQNADNSGGVNPATNMVVDVARGEEYITNLSFDPSTFTIAVPEPSLPVLMLAGAGMLLRRRVRS